MASFPTGAARNLCAAILLAAGLALPTFASEILIRELKYPDGTLKERYGYTLDGAGQEVRQGRDEEFFPGGARKGERNWKDGRNEGAVVYFHPNGRKSYETHYVDGKKNGFATVWYMNGQKQWQTTFKGGKTHGRWREWYLDGRKKFEATYSEGLLDGLATWWHDNGRLWQERSYAAGEPVKGTVREWDRTGRQTYPPPEGQVAEAEPAGDDPAGVPPATATRLETPE